jgi:hypothetical protein
MEPCSREEFDMYKRGGVDGSELMLNTLITVLMNTAPSKTKSCPAHTSSKVPQIPEKVARTAR